MSIFDKPTDQTVKILNRHLNRDFRVFPLAEDKTSAEQVQTLAQQLGVVFPAELIAHLSGQFPGIYIEAKEEVWPRHKVWDVGPFWSFLYGFHTYTVASDSEDWMRLEYAAKEFQLGTGLPAVPVLKIIGDADLYCVNVDGKFSRFNHELNELEPLELGFFQLFEQEVAALCERTKRKKSNG